MSQEQYGRAFKLIAATAGGSGLDFSDLRVVFEVKKSDAQTPNTASLKIYNVANDTASRVKREFTRVILQAGYESNFGVIFDGNIKEARVGRENGTDTYLQIEAGDGDQAYNLAIVNTTLAAGATQRNQVDAAAQPMQALGVSQGAIDLPQGEALPRGKVMYGMSKDYLRGTAQSSGASWSMQDGKLQMLPLTSTLPGTAVVLTSKTGLIGTPEQSDKGINATCLLNPTLKIGSKVKIDEESIALAKLKDTGKDAPVNKPVDISADGIYRLLSVTHKGDTRGTDWYSELVCLDVDATAPAKNQVAKT